MLAAMIRATTSMMATITYAPAWSTFRPARGPKIGQVARACRTEHASATPSGNTGAGGDSQCHAHHAKNKSAVCVSHRRTHRRGGERRQMSISVAAMVHHPIPECYPRYGTDRCVRKAVYRKLGVATRCSAVEQEPSVTWRYFTSVGIASLPSRNRGRRQSAVERP
jgi:hypothetical protein